MAEKVLGIRIEIKGTEKQNKELGTLRTRIQQIKTEQKLLNKAFDKGEVSAERYGKDMSALEINLKKTTNASNDLKASILKQNNSLRKNSGFVSGIKKGVGQLATSFIGVTAAIGIATRVIGGAIDIVKNFSKASSDLEAVLGDLAKEDGVMNSLRTQAKELGATTAFTATQVLELQKEFAKLGFNPAQIENMTEATLNLAAAAGTDLANAAEIAGSVINQFGLTAADATHVTDVMALSFSSSGLDIEKFKETMKSAGPIAKATGVSLEQAAAAAGKLADAGISGSKAGTDLRRIFSELVKDGKPLNESLQDISASLSAAETPAEKLAIAEGLVGERAKAALLVLVDQKDTLNVLTGELENADGAAKDMADTMLNNLSGDITKAGSAWEGFILSLEDGDGIFSRVSRNFVNGLTEMLGGLTNLNQFDFKGLFDSESSTSFLMSISDLSENINSVMNPALAAAQKQMSEVAFKGFEVLDNKIKEMDTTQLSSKETVHALAKQYEDLGLSSTEAEKRVVGLVKERIAESKALRESSKELDTNTESEEDNADALDVNKKALNDKNKAAEKAFNDEKKRRDKALKDADKNAKAIATSAIKKELKQEEDKNKAIAKAQENVAKNKIAAIQDERVKERAELKAKFEEQLQDIQGDGMKETALRMEIKFQRDTAIREQQAGFDEIDAAKKVADDLLEAEADSAKQQAKLNAISAGLEIAGTLQDANKNRVINRLNEERDAELAVLDEQLANKNISEQQREDLLNQREVKENEHNEIILAQNKKFARLDKILKVATIGVNLALELSAINTMAAANLTNIPTAGVAGVTQSAVLSGIAIGKAAANVALVLSQKTFAEGGMLSGPSHAGGGIPFTVAGQGGFEAEGGEAIINKNSMSNPYLRDIASWVNVQGGGTAFAKGGMTPTRFQSGGDVPNVSAPGGLDAESLSEAIAESVGNIKIINVATETAGVASEVQNIESDASFG